jgi:hypothetical protein
MNKMNQIMNSEVFAEKGERHICHLLSDKFGLGGSVDFREVGR